MKKADTTLEDVAESIGDLATMMADLIASTEQRLVGMVKESEQRLVDMVKESEQRLVGMLKDSEQRLITRMDSGFAAVRQEMDTGFAAVRREMDAGFATVHHEMATKTEMQAGFDRLEGKYEALEADVKELYHMIDDLRRDFKVFTAKERRRFADLEAFAEQVAEKTGIPYRSSKPKLRP